MKKEVLLKSAAVIVLPVSLVLAAGTASVSAVVPQFEVDNVSSQQVEIASSGQFEIAQSTRKKTQNVEEDESKAKKKKKRKRVRRGSFFFGN